MGNAAVDRTGLSGRHTCVKRLEAENASEIIISEEGTNLRFEGAEGTESEERSEVAKRAGPGE